MTGILAGVRYDDPLARYRGEKLVEIVKKLSRVRNKDIDTNLGVDIFYLFYLPFPLPVPPKDQRDRLAQLRYLVARGILSNAEARKIRYYTIAHSGRSIIVGASFLEHLLQELSPQSEGEGGQGGQKNQGEDQGQPSNENDNERSSNNIQNAIRNAIRRVMNEVDSLSKLEQMAMGTQAGTGSMLEMIENSSDIIRLARNTDVQRLLDSLSFIEELTFKTRKKMIKSSRGEVIGYSRGSQLTRISRTELALFETREAEQVLLYKWATGKLILYEKVVRQDIGPLYVLLDKSGSMDGEKIRWAKATAIALFMRSRREGRPFLIRFFDSAPYNLIKVSRSGKSSETLRLMDYLARIKSGGGTDITRSIITACQDVAELKMRGLGELILITDGEDRLAENMVRKHLRENNVRLITVMVMGENPDLRKISSKYFKVVRLSNKEMLEVLEL
ncbi:MAG TPA: VWA domain-containing protein [Sulfolobales archaeon]|nr:VWA domain-containing protein [Sulfolobales archaeon]